VSQPTKSRPVGNRRKKISDLPAEYSPDLPEKVKWDVVAVCRHELRKRKREGRYDGNPDDFHPARYLANVVEDETVAHPIRVVAAKELMPYFGIDKATLARIEAGLGNDGAHITVVISDYAAGKPTPAIEAKPAIDVVRTDTAVGLHRGTPVTPEPKLEKYAQFEVIDGTAQPIVTSEGKIATADETIIDDGYGNSYRIKGSI